jgi:hypothetical protein
MCFHGRKNWASKFEAIVDSVELYHMFLSVIESIVVVTTMCTLQAPY